MCFNLVKLTINPINNHTQIALLIHKLPDNVTIDEVVYHTYVKSRVMKGKQQLQEGKGIPHSEIEAEIEQWLK